MSSSAKIAANRTNAKFSTGPRTPAGKARASQNATKFGLFSGTFTHPGEEKDYAAIRASLREAFDPQTAPEQAALDQICGAVWRLRRCNQLEAAIVTPLDRAIRRARRQANRILRKSVLDLKAQKRIRKNEPNFPVAA
jgi:hypothetical protein